MNDSFEATFVVELAPSEVWEALTRRTIQREGAEDADVHYVLAGFPSFPPLEVPGASCRLLESNVGELLRVKKDDHPCLGTEIAIRLEQAETGTRITVVQSGFGPFLEMVGRDTVFGHGRQIVNDLQLYIERGVTVPGTAWGASLGAITRQTPTGLEVATVHEQGFCADAGIVVGDLLLTLGGIRIHDHPQLWTVLALSEMGSEAEASWVRGREPMSGTAKIQP